MAREWTDEEVEAEIGKAVQIVREDRERAAYKQLHDRYGQKPDGEDKPKDGKQPPPPKDEDKEPPKPANKKRSIWWGDRLDSDE